ncbi:uncharacterized protein LOC134751220 [Cydia strobilella]|uniref:uncharacterized protein LOC134751220 n=1 Tax=Cydia strobilella TaxID=1100964 RepID=UPI003005C324
MESIKQSMSEMAEDFKKQMAAFQSEIDKAAPSSPTVASVSADFSTFRRFILGSLDALQKQVNFLGQQLDQQEMRSRRKMLLLHGVPESEGDSPASAVELLNRHLESKLSVDDVRRCHRVGRPHNNRLRCILMKFTDVSVRNSVWFGKKCLKGTGVTVSEFLTAPRHAVFMAARERLGIRSCWTRDGNVFVLDAAGKRCCVTTVADVEQFPAATSDRAEVAPTAAIGAVQPPAARAKRNPRSRV